MSLLAVLGNFTPGTPIISGEVNAVEAQLVNTLNGTLTNKNLLVRFSGPSDPPSDFDQLGAGLVARWKSSGVAVATITNAGSFSTTQQFISSLATGIAPLSVASTTKVTNLNADAVDGIEGADVVRKSDTADQTIVSNLAIGKVTPVLGLTHSTGSKTVRIVNDGTNWLFIDDVAGNTPLSIALATGVPTFGVIPVGPASNPTTDNQLARKAYVDSKTTAWSTGWLYYVVPSAVETTETQGRFICPEGTTIKITKVQGVYGGGSHTSGASLVWTIKRRNSAGVAQADVGTITLDNTNDDKDILYSNDIGDVTLSSGDQIYPLLTTRSGTITEGIVTVNLIGIQTVIT